MTGKTHSDAGRQLPQHGEIFLDHLGHFVADPDAAGRALAGAGFAPTPQSIQMAPSADAGPPQRTGTGNVTAMLSRGYIEVLFKTADTPLGREFDAAIKEHAGLHLIALSVADAAAALARLEAAGFRVRPLVHFERPVETASGSDTAAFTVARVAAGEMREGRVQILTHRTERAVWQPRWLAHPNGASALGDVVIVSADIEEAAERFARFTGRKAVPSRFGLSVGLDRGRLELINPAGFAALAPGAALPRLPFIAGFAVQVRSLAATESLLRSNGLPSRVQSGVLIVPFPAALGIGTWFFTESLAGLPWRQQTATPG